MNMEIELLQAIGEILTGGGTVICVTALIIVERRRVVLSDRLHAHLEADIEHERSKSEKDVKSHSGDS